MIAFAEAGDPVLLIAKVPAEFSDAAHDLECFAIPVMSRNNGLLLCVPRGVFSEDVLIDCLSGDDVLHVIGPSKGIPVQLHEEGDDQTAVPVPGNVNVLLVDLSDDALVWLREYDQKIYHPFLCSTSLCCSGGFAVGSFCTRMDVFGQDKRGISLWKALFESGTSSMVIGGSCLCERNGSVAKQKARTLSQTTKECRPRESIAKKKAKISEEASLRSGASKGPMRMKREVISDMDGQVPDGAVLSAVMHDDVVNTRNDLFDKKISFASWCAQMVASVFRTRTPFSAFVRSAIHLTRDPQVSTSPAFPIPLPHFGVFGRMPSGLSLRQRSRYHFRRAVVLTILALNFWWSGNRFLDLNLLRRSPSVSQRRIIRRVVDFMQVDGPKIPFEVSLAGRRSPQLVARLCELSDALTSAGVRGSPYDHTFEGRSDAVPTDNTAMPELEPYRSLDFERLMVVGEGHFDPVPFLDDNLGILQS